MNKNILNANELHVTADLANARKQALQRLDAEMCISTVIKPECQKEAREGYYCAVIARTAIDAYNPKNMNMFDSVLGVLDDEGVKYEITANGNLKIMF